MPDNCDFSCRDTRVCVSDAECAIDNDCEADSYCLEGVCERGCRLEPDSCSVSEDGVLEVCDPSNRRCSETVNCCPPGEACQRRLPTDCPEQGCALDDDCPGAQICTEGSCVEPATCGADEDCFGDRYCADAVCVEACVEDADCSGAGACVDGRCVVNDACFADADCGDNRICEGMFCVDGCNSDRDCETAEVCDTASGRCASTVECSGDDECLPEEICTLDSLCRRGCRMAEDCAPGQRCNLEMYACERDVECISDDECADGQRCRGNACGPECDVDNLCDLNQRCSDAGVCEALPACIDDAECAMGSCQDGFCRVCIENGDCSGAEVCLVDSGLCVEPCFDDSGCLQAERCEINSGQCVAVAACMNDLSCEVTEVCDDATGLCEPEGVCQVDNDCRAGRVCAAGGCVNACDDVSNPCDRGFACNAVTGQCDSLPGCLGGLQCEGTRQCDQNTGACPERTTDCFGAADCDAGRICDCAGLNDSLAACIFPGGQCVPDCRQQGCTGGVCNQTTALCEDAAGLCLNDSDCTGRRLCQNGTCVDNCVDSGCPGNRDCDAVTGRCAESDNCFNDSECALGRVCDQGSCADRCASSDECEDGAVCDAVQNTCRACRGDAECPNRWSCLGGTCTRPELCFFAQDCPSGQVCNPASGACLPACANDTECPGRQVCGQGLFCAENGCEVATAALDCLDDRICVQDACTERCAAGTCAGGQTCNLATGVCEFDAGFCAMNSDCAGDQFCVDGVCLARIPGTCDVDTDCDGGDVCSPFGRCVVDHVCGGDDGCQAGVAFCVDGQCQPCVADADCGALPGFVCEANRCFYDAQTCVADNDCPDTRFCVEGFCEAGGCAGDDLDAVELPILDNRTYQSLILCDGDEDRYVLVVPAGYGASIQLSHEPNDGDLSLTLFSGDDEVDFSDTAYGVETVSVLPADIQRTYFVSILGGQGRNTLYNLSVISLEPGECAPDGGEGAFNNDAPTRARMLDIGSQTVISCPCDIDWFSLSTGPGMVVEAAATASSAPVSLNLYVQGQEDAAPLVSGSTISYDTAGSTDSMMLELTGDANESQSISLELNVSSAPDGIARTCSVAPTYIENGGLLLLPLQYPVSHRDLSCFPDGVGETQEHVVRFVPSLNSDYLISSSLYAAFEVFVGGCGATATSVGCGDNGGASNAIRVSLLPVKKLYCGQDATVLRRRYLHRAHGTLR